MAAPLDTPTSDIFVNAPFRFDGKTINKRASVVNFQRPQPLVPVNTVTPPLTPQTSGDDLNTMMTTLHQQIPFSEYLRAFYGYYPPYDADSSTVTLPLNAGDLILVHSIHDNGWADGTLLNSGVRGWFPTNYCEPYDHDSIRSLLRALTNFFDIVRSGADGNIGVFCNQDYMRGLVAGVRYLLEKTGCLNRESPMVSSRLSLSRNRKALLSDLSVLVKIAKALQSDLTATHAQPELDGGYIDDMVLRAFKLVLRAAKFHDVWLQIVMDEESVDGLGSPLRPDSAATRLSDVGVMAREHHRRDSATLSGMPPTPLEACFASYPGAGLELQHEQQQYPQYSQRSPHSGLPRPAANRHSTSFHRRSRNTPSMLFSNPQTPQPFTSNSRPSSFQRMSVSHRISYASKLDAVCRDNLASERLTQAHDGLLTSLGSFIGIHVSSRTSQELVHTTQECLDGAQKLVDVLKTIWDRGYFGSENIHEIAELMFNRIANLVDSVQSVFASLQEPVADFQPADRRQMTDAATSCIRAAGEVVSKGRYVLEMIGDFEFERDEARPSVFENNNLVPEERPEELVAAAAATDAAEATSSVRTSLTQRPASLVIPPQPPFEPPPPPVSSPTPLRIDTVAAAAADQSASVTPPVERASNGSWLPPLPRLASPVFPSADFGSDQALHHSFVEVSDDSLHFTSQTENDRNSSVKSDSTFTGSKRTSEQSSVSMTSTRATSPEPADKFVASEPLTESIVEDQAQDTEAEEEEKVLEKTYAHELVFNKEGQITGGTLPALVERLTTHDSTPEPLFVATFYLTFRLFASPQQFAQALIDRFEYVSETRSIAGPVQLRVYNVFKGWIESHWQPDSDRPALDLISDFASSRLTASLPTAGRHLVDLIQKVNQSSGNLTPRLVSSVGKTNVSLTSYVSPNAPIPSPILNKSQNNILKAWKDGKAQPSILDFEPMELARQFTLKVSTVFCSIMPEELLATEWTKKSGSVAVNVRSLSTLSTDLANLVADCILMLEDPNKRAKLIKQWVKIAKACLELQNYDSLIAIVCSLNSTTILRLKRTWDAVSAKTKATLSQLNAIVDCSKNYSALRQQLTQAAPPCLPFVGMYLTDLTFVDAGNPNSRTLADDTTVINFDKHVKTAKIISELQRFQIPYRLQEVPELQTWMQDQLVRVRSSEQGMGGSSYYRRSLMLEPRELKCVGGISPLIGSGPFSPTEVQSPKDRWGMMFKGALTRNTDNRRPSVTSTELAE